MIDGYWKTAWSGRLRHFWVSPHETLCGNTRMTAHLPDFTDWDPPRCMRCEKKLREHYTAIASKLKRSKTVKRVKCLVYSRVVGYLRPTQDWNVAKKQEFKDRKNYVVKGQKKEGSDE